MKIAFRRTLLILALFQFSLFAFGQVYPYAYYPEKGVSKNKKYGLVADNKKITEPIFDYIEPFLNQPINQYTLYSKMDEGIRGIINKKGEVVEGIEGRNLTYDGNGRIAIIFDNGLKQLINIETKKTILETEDLQVRDIISGKRYYIILSHRKSQVYSIIDEDGKDFLLEGQPYQEWKYIKHLDDQPIFEIQINRNTYKYYNGEGNEISEDLVFSDEDEDDYPAFADHSIDLNQDEMKLMITQDVLAKYPEWTIGKLFQDRYDKVKLVEIIDKDGNHGLTKPNGEMVLECKYVSIRPLYSDFDDDEKDDKYYLEYKDYNGAGIIAMYGRVIFKPKFGFIQFVPKANLFSLMTETLYWGYASNRGTVFLPKECECLD
ncbi:MAG: hypothetical protein NXI23_11825 [Bacteroidetes bacterium]|jgi:hypothetical protein|nr:hypothetical protein [Bacteroidota bacterium]